MTLLGLTLTQLGLIFGAVGGTVTVLYILKLRRRRVRVPFSKLWDRVLKEKESTSLFRRLKRLLSLLLQLLFLLLLTAALGDPRLSTEVLDGRHIVLLVDTSASMKARDAEGGTRRLDQALARSRRIVRGMNGADVMMLVRMDAQVTPLTGFEGDEQKLLDALRQLGATDTRADLPRALKFCRDALHGKKNAQLILIGDGAYPQEQLDLVDMGRPERAQEEAAAGHKARRPHRPGKRTRSTRELARVDLRGVTVRYVPVGRSRDNVGIVAFNARRYVRNKLSFEVFLEVVNYRKVATEADLQLYSDGELIDVQRLRLNPGQTARYTCDPDDRKKQRKAWCDLAATGEMLEARLVAPGSTADKPRALDPFPPDDRAYALLPQRKKQHVLLVTEGNLFLEGAMLLEPNLALTRVKPAAYTDAIARRADAIIFDGNYPAKPPPRPALVINPPERGGPFKVTGRLQSPLITDQDSDHPVMRWVTLKDINISSSARFAAEPGVDVLAASFRQPVMVARREGATKLVAFGFDLTRSDLPLRVAFPILILNTLDWFAGDSEDLLTSYRTGDTWAVPLPGAAGDDTVEVLRPDGTRAKAPVSDGRALVHGVLAGVYTLRGRDGTGERRLAANLADPVESRIQPRRTLTLGGTTLQRPSGFGVGLRREIWIYLLIAAAMLTLLEWLSYNRRATV